MRLVSYVHWICSSSSCIGNYFQHLFVLISLLLLGIGCHERCLRCKLLQLHSHCWLVWYLTVVLWWVGGRLLNLVDFLLNLLSHLDSTVFAFVQRLLQARLHVVAQALEMLLLRLDLYWRLRRLSLQNLCWSLCTQKLKVSLRHLLV